MASAARANLSVTQVYLSTRWLQDGLLCDVTWSVGALDRDYSVPVHLYTNPSIIWLDWPSYNPSPSIVQSKQMFRSSSEPFAPFLSLWQSILGSQCEFFWANYFGIHEFKNRVALLKNGIYIGILVYNYLKWVSQFNLSGLIWSGTCYHSCPSEGPLKTLYVIIKITHEPRKITYGK